MNEDQLESYQCSDNGRCDGRILLPNITIITTQSDTKSRIFVPRYDCIECVELICDISPLWLMAFMRLRLVRFSGNGSTFPLDL